MTMRGRALRQAGELVESEARRRLFVFDQRVDSIDLEKRHCLKRLCNDFVLPGSFHRFFFEIFVVHLFSSQSPRHVAAGKCWFCRLCCSKNVILRSAVGQLRARCRARVCSRHAVNVGVAGDGVERRRVERDERAGATDSASGPASRLGGARCFVGADGGCDQRRWRRRRTDVGGGAGGAAIAGARRTSA